MEFFIASFIYSFSFPQAPASSSASATTTTSSSERPRFSTSSTHRSGATGYKRGNRESRPEETSSKRDNGSSGERVFSSILIFVDD